MTGKRTYQVVTPYGIFTRTTAHRYTHVVVGCGLNAAFYEAAVADAERRYAKHPPLPHQLDWLEYLRRMLEGSHKNQAEGIGRDLIWSRSLRNAETAARTLRRRHNVVGIYEVPLPEERS